MKKVCCGDCNGNCEEKKNDMSGNIKYTITGQKKWKYKLLEDYHIRVVGFLGYNSLLKYVSLSSGILRICADYAWDGPSGPAVDTVNFQRASLVHDALYQLIREGGLPQKKRKIADRILYSIAREDGMSILRATYVYLAVRAIGWIYTKHP